MSYFLHADQIVAEVASNTNRLNGGVIDRIQILNAVNCEYKIRTFTAVKNMISEKNDI
jgi:hypothetical protein